jgi:hypothetical protein
MNLIIKKDTQVFGPHSSEEISVFVQNGDLSLSDLASPEGEENWQPLQVFLTDESEDQNHASMMDQFEDDEVDYEKLKEWEDVFIDEDEEESDISEDLNEVADNNNSDHSLPPPLIETESPASRETVSSVPPPLIIPPLVNPEPVKQPDPVPTFPDASERNDENIVPPLPKLPPPPDRPLDGQDKGQEKGSSRAPRDRISNSRKIKGLNSKQTVIVVKGEGIIAKIYSTSLFFIILIIIVSLLGFAGLIFAPDRTIPILTNLGVPLTLIETIVSPVKSS